MTFAWKKDNEVLNDAEIHNQAHLRVQAGAGGDTEVTEYTTTLQLRNVEFSSEGKYQCVISNHFGSSYSNKARLTVNSTFEKGEGKCVWNFSLYSKIPDKHLQDPNLWSFLSSSAAILYQDANGPEYPCWSNSQA